MTLRSEQSDPRAGTTIRQSVAAASGRRCLVMVVKDSAVEDSVLSPVLKQG